jgi:signal transduction histidine kinase
MFTKETWYNQRRLYHVFLLGGFMKLKSKLIISFCIIMFVPIFLSLLIIATFFRVQWQMIAQNIVVVPDYRGLFFDIVFSILLILLLTAGMLMIWIYQSMVTPIRKLQVAANNIKEGNLDFTIDTEGAEQDEVNELCVTFEEMRRRLKENAEEKIASEQENKDLISNIAHDLKTPITAVKGYAEGIIDGVANTPEKIDKYVRTIYSKANEMDTLINELTLYSKFDTNKIPYNFAKINVEEYFDDCIEEIGIDLENKGIGLAYYNYTERDVMIIADPEQLRRVVNNIIGNSAKYMNKSNGFINVRIKDVGDFIQVEIEDNGRGIPQKDLPYIFDRFYRGDVSRNSATGGSGIGLSIVKKIIEDHGGKIWATSKEDTGTVMYFVIRKYQEVPNE